MKMAETLLEAITYLIRIDINRQVGALKKNHPSSGVIFLIVLVAVLLIHVSAKTKLYRSVIPNALHLSMLAIHSILMVKKISFDVPPDLSSS